MNLKIIAVVVAILVAGLGGAVWFWGIRSPADASSTPAGSLAAEDETACGTAVRSAGRLNGSALFAGSGECGIAARFSDANYLMIVGQIRSMADMTILTPVDDANMMLAAALYGDIYYKYGGLGFTEFYRSTSNVSAIAARVLETSISFESEYDPGWKYAPASKTNLYARVVTNARNQRLWQMHNFALKIQDDHYYQIFMEIEKLGQQNNNSFVEGTPAAQENARLTRELEEAGRAIPDLPPPEDTTPYAELAAESPEQAEQTRLVGFNGPAAEDLYVFASESDVRKSWLAAAVSQSELNKLISGTDFSKQILVALSFGERRNASGKISISVGHRYGGYFANAQIGVIPQSCGVDEAASYPFAVGVTDAVPDTRGRSRSSSNYPDECGPVAVGQASSAPN